MNKSFSGSTYCLNESGSKGEFKGMNKGRPNEDDLKAAREFAKALKKEQGE